MLSPSDFNNAVPQFTNGNYASNPLNPQYIAEPSSTDYNKGVEPIQTLPAQWWNWFMNKFTARFNKVNVYVKNIFNELSQLLSLVSETPSGTEGDPTIGQLKDMFETKYPDYLKTVPALSNTYVPQTTKVNGQALSGNVTICCVACAGANGSGTAFGTAATHNVKSACGLVDTNWDCAEERTCVPDLEFLSYWNGAYSAAGASNLRYFRGGAFGSAAACEATDFRPSTWTPTCVSCTSKIRRFAYSEAYLFNVALWNGCSLTEGENLYVSSKCLLLYCNTTGVLYANYFCGRASDADSAGISCTFGNVVATKNQKMHTWNVYACQSGSITSVPICDIAKAICWATNNMANYYRTTISGHLGCNTIVQQLASASSNGFCIYEGTGSNWSWASYYYTCATGRVIPMSISGSY